jgi:hypothetical protein
MLAANCRELFRFEPILMVRYRWPHSQASEDAPMGAGTWPNKPGPPDTPPNGVYGPKPQLFTLIFAAIVVVVSHCNSFETKHKVDLFKS